MLHVLVAVLDPAADAQAVGMVRALRAAVPSLDVSRLGGLALAREGTLDITAAGSLDAGLRRTLPDAALLVGGGSLRQARLARRLWRGHRIPVAVVATPDDVKWPWIERRLVASCQVLLVSPIDDVAALDASRVAVRRVGHPLADEVTLPLAADRAGARRVLGLTEDHPVVAVCPGAASFALRRIASPLREAVVLLQGGPERVQVAVAASDAASAGMARRLLDGVPGLTVHAAPEREVCTAADVALCGDGETSLLAALLGTPLVLARRRPWRERVVRRAAPRLGGRVPAFEAWPNRVLGTAVVPELLDEDCRAPLIAARVAALVADAADQVRRLADVRKAVRADRAWASIATLLLDMALVQEGRRPNGQPPTVKRNS